MTFAARLTELNNAVHERLQPLASQIRTAWEQRTPREQTLLRAGALLLMAVLLWELVLGPSWRTIQKAREQLPILQAQSAQLGAIILEAQALTRKRTGSLPAGEAEPALHASLQAAGLETVSRLTRPAGATDQETQWQVQFTNAPAGRIIEWLNNVTVMAPIQTVRVDLTRSILNDRERPGQLDGLIVLKLLPQGSAL